MLTRMGLDFLQDKKSLPFSPSPLVLFCNKARDGVPLFTPKTPSHSSPPPPPQSPSSSSIKQTNPIHTYINTQTSPSPSPSSSLLLPPSALGLSLSRHFLSLVVAKVEKRERWRDSNGKTHDRHDPIPPLSLSLSPLLELQFLVTPPDKFNFT